MTTDDTSDPLAGPPRRLREGSPQLTTIGVWLFLASLTMLFAASLVGYILIRLNSANNPQAGREAVPLGTLHLPRELWISTCLVIGVSFALWRATDAVQHEHQLPFRLWLGIALILAAGFIAVQSPAMARLLSMHKTLQSSTSGTALYGLVFVLILLHALHVVGGIIALVRIVVRGMQGRYDHEHYSPVRHATLYWHFLDIVWIVMFTTFWLTR
ncbi:MAG TPA: cytochrome c oxidase subunit 3 [Humisphaera sp.]|nr:cytochrome c oxidase subunit 3 [Humisphaera sp.]